MSSTRKRLGAVAMLTAAAFAVGAVPAANAADTVSTVSTSVTPGTRTASVADLVIPAVSYSHSAQNQTGTMTLNADDSTGSGAGWNVTIMSSAFTYSGTNVGTDIDAAGFSLTSAATPTATAGQAVDATNGPKVPTQNPVGTLDTARKVVQANASFGQGTYAQQLGVNLAIPAQSRAGTYTGTLTTTISAAP